MLVVAEILVPTISEKWKYVGEKNQHIWKRRILLESTKPTIFKKERYVGAAHPTNKKKKKKVGSASNALTNFFNVFSIIIGMNYALTEEGKSFEEPVICLLESSIHK